MAAKNMMHGWVRRTSIEVAGWTLVVFGIAALVLPGPGLLMVVGGLAILSQQYAWARRRLAPMKARAFQAAAVGVKTIPRIAASCLGAFTVMGCGVLWTLQPPVPPWWPYAPHWWLFGGSATGVSMVLSSFIALALIVYSVRRFRGKPPPGKTTVSERP
ncbi:PGPGW domain-containing protein [Arthrobacter sp. TMN-37]